MKIPADYQEALRQLEDPEQLLHASKLLQLPLNLQASLGSLPSRQRQILNLGLPGENNSTCQPKRNSRKKRDDGWSKQPG